MRFRLVEEIVRDDDINMTITDSVYEVKNVLLNAGGLTRIFYDKTIDKYMVCDGNYYIHKDMINKAIEYGYYDIEKSFLVSKLSKVLKNKSDIIFLSWCPKDSNIAKDFETLLQDVASDGYKKEFAYESGYIFSQETSGTLPFKATDLCSALGNCIESKIKYDAPLIRK